MVYGLYFFSLCPLDRIKAADTCDDPYLLNASKKLKENPDIFWKWRDWKEESKPEGEKLFFKGFYFSVKIIDFFTIDVML